MPKSPTQIRQEVQAYLRTGAWRQPSSGHPDETLFRVEISDDGRPSLTLQRRDYKTALRAARAELLGSGGDLAKIFWKKTLVAEGYLQRRRVRGGEKQSVLFVGEKPRRNPTR